MIVEFFPLRERLVQYTSDSEAGGLGVHARAGAAPFPVDATVKLLYRTGGEKLCSRTLLSGLQRVRDDRPRHSNSPPSYTSILQTRVCHLQCTYSMYVTQYMTAFHMKRLDRFCTTVLGRRQREQLIPSCCVSRSS